jgi:hypothetical protein
MTTSRIFNGGIVIVSLKRQECAFCISNCLGCWGNGGWWTLVEVEISPHRGSEEESQEAA